MALTKKRIKEMSRHKGFTIRRNNNGICVISCHYTADPEKDEAWVIKTKRGYPESSWAREYEMNREVIEGARVYPKFENSIHAGATLNYNPALTIYRGWDFGYHHPAVVWVQRNEFDQLCVLGELVGNDVTIDSFYQQVLDKERQWFRDRYGNPPTDVHNWGDPAGNQRKDVQAAGLRKDENTTIKVLQRLGCYIRTKKYDVLTMVNLVRSLLEVRGDGLPGLLVDPTNCPVLIQGFNGGYVCEHDKTKDIPKEKPKKDGMYDHAHDSLQYVACGMFDPATRKPAGYYGDRPQATNWEDWKWEYEATKRVDNRTTGRSNTTGY